MSRFAEGIEAKRDTLLERYPDRVFGKVHVSRSIDFITATPAIGAQIVGVKDCGWGLWLDNQCDEYEVGTPEDAQQFIADLQAAIDYCASFDES